MRFVLFVSTMVFVTSQLEFKITQSVINDDDPNNIFKTDKSQMTKKNAYLMKGFVLIIMGLTLEYSRLADLYIFCLSLCISIIKILEGFVILNKDENDPEERGLKTLLSNFLLAYGILNSVKYI